MEWNDVYDKNRLRTGKIHRRGTQWKPGEFGLVACVWVYDGEGSFLLTRRAKGKSYAGTWENSGGAAKAGEDSRQAVSRELFEETGILLDGNAFEFLQSDEDKTTFYDHYCALNPVALEKIVLLPGETEAVMWASYRKIHTMIHTGEICSVIANQFLRLEPMLRLRNIDKFA